MCDLQKNLTFELDTQQDRFASGNEEPKIDSHQDWNLLQASENHTWTYLKFSRLVDTCNKDEDYPISVIQRQISFKQLRLIKIKTDLFAKKATSRVIWAIGPTDEFVKHSMADRGARSIDFLHKRPKFNAAEFAKDILINKFINESDY